MKGIMQKVITFFLLFRLVLSAFWSVSAQPVQPNPGLFEGDPTTLRLGISGYPELDPGRVVDDVSIAISTHLFRGLTKLDDSGRVQPDLAETWQTSEDLRSWTFKLKPDLYWVDGSGSQQAHLTARDVAAAWARTSEPENSPLLDQFIIEDCYAVDDNTVVFQLSEPYGGFPYLLSSPNTFPVPEDLIEVYGEDWDRADIIWTSGPYFLQSFTPETSLTLLRNPHWPETYEVLTERLEVIYAEDQALLSAFRADDLDVIWLSDPSVLAEVGDDPELAPQVVSIPSLEVFGYAFSPSLRQESPQVRRALSLTVDRQAVCGAVLGWETPLGVMLPPGAFGHRPVPLQIYDPLLAAAQWEEIGYEGGAQIPLSLGYVPYHCSDPITQGVLAGWEDFGFDLTPNALDWAAMIDKNYRQAWEEPPDDILMWPWAVIEPDPLYYYWLNIYNGRHLSGWQNDAFDDLIASGMTATENDERADFLWAAEEILLWEDPLFIPVCSKSHVFLAKSNVFFSLDVHRIFNAAQSVVNAAYKAVVEKETGVTLTDGDRDWTTREVKLFSDVYKIYKDNLGKDLVKNLGKLKTIVRKKAAGGTVGKYNPGTDTITLYDAANTMFDFKNSDDQFKGTLAHEMLHLLLAYNPKDGTQYGNIYTNPLLKGYLTAINKALDDETGETERYGWHMGLHGWELFLPEAWDFGLNFLTGWKYFPPTDYGKTNPEEDFAESIMFYILEPAKLDSTRYDYIKTHIFNGKEFK